MLQVRHISLDEFDIGVHSCELEALPATAWRWVRSTPFHELERLRILKIFLAPLAFGEKIGPEMDPEFATQKVKPNCTWEGTSPPEEILQRLHRGCLLAESSCEAGRCHN